MLPHVGAEDNSREGALFRARGGGPEVLNPSFSLGVSHNSGGAAGAVEGITEQRARQENKEKSVSPRERNP